MLFAAMLTLHIAIACATIVAIVFSSYALMRERREWFVKLAGTIAIFAAVETVTGFMLVVLASNISASYVIAHLLLYLGLCLIVEAALLLNSRLVWIG